MDEVERLIEAAKNNRYGHRDTSRRTARLYSARRASSGARALFQSGLARHIVLGVRRIG
jgi:hypothetical protein